MAKAGQQKDWAFVRKRCAKSATRMFDGFDRKRRQILTEVAREFYPVAVAGLARRIEDVADETPYDEDHRLLTTRPLDALRKGACGFHGNLTSPARRWFRFRPAGSDEVAPETLDALTEAVERVMRGSDLYPSLYRLYEHVLCFGFGCMLVTADARRVIRARTLRMGTYALGVGDDGQVCRVARKFSWTAEQLLSRFGDAGAPEAVREAARKGDDERRWTVVNLVEPNATGDMRAYDPISRAIGLDDSMTWRSVYWLEAAKDDDPQAGVLEMTGFRVKPMVAPRIDYEPGDAYGRGRGMDALCLARGVQSFEYDILNVSGIKGKQPLVVASDFKDDGFRAGRGGVNYARFGEQRGALAYPVFPNLPDTTDLRVDRQDLEAEIADLFFNSAFATIDALKNNSGVKTATEVDALIRENMERLNPIVTNLDRELLDPLVTVATRYALDAGAAPLSDKDRASLSDVDVEYVSQIHLAAKASRIGAVDQWTQRLGALAQAFPEVLDKADADGVADELADMLGVPAAIRADDDAVAKKREARDRQQQMAQEAAQAETLGRAAKIAAAPVDDDHLGGAIMKGLQGDALGGMA